jgi:hypothetical protein
MPKRIRESSSLSIHEKAVPSRASAQYVRQPLCDELARLGSACIGKINYQDRP